MSSAHAFVDPSFLSGLSRLADFEGSLDEHVDHAALESIAEVADYESLQSDWKAVGLDIERAMRDLSQRMAATTEAILTADEAIELTSRENSRHLLKSMGLSKETIEAVIREAEAAVQEAEAKGPALNRSAK